ncbi:MAG: CPBP family intramembrane metalloprotease [Candidatus Aenigmarchaeota archaeon]|nr:CPBP family intramembrane metalloprotease [Candidatus Aenigmarchaeota archaeon]
MAELRKFGITTKDMTHSLRHAAIITAVGFVVVTLIGNLIGFKALHIDSSWLVFYILISVPLQELVFRGIIQTKLYRLGAITAIAASSVLYAAIHFQSLLLIILTLTAGAAWGYSFSKRPTLIGPVVSHALLGAYLFLFVL